MIAGASVSRAITVIFTRATIVIIPVSPVVLSLAI